VPRKSNRPSDDLSTDRIPADVLLDEEPRPPVPPILAVVQEECAIGDGAIRLAVSLRVPGGRLIETRVLMAGAEAADAGLADAALADLAAGWAAALDPTLADHSVVVVRP
jgi:hypothetical protein